MNKLVAVATSRKSIIASVTTLATMLIVVLNKQLDLGLNQEAINAIVTAATVLGTAMILGIAIEDNGEKSAGKKPPDATSGGPTPAVFLLFLLPLLSGCFTIQQRDETTIAHVDRSIDNWNHDVPKLIQALKNDHAAALSMQEYSKAVVKEAADRGCAIVSTPPAVTLTADPVIRGFEGLCDSENHRLQFFRQYEASKKAADR